MYSVLPSYALGFHGCDAELAEQILAGSTHLQHSRNDFDWLGEGIYFWENSPLRALQYAIHQQTDPRPSGPKIKAPAVIGAIIELGYCFNLLDAEFLSLMLESYEDLKSVHEKVGLALPENRRIGNDVMIRRLDCAVINSMHQTRSDRGLRPFDTVRAAFAEGGPLYPASGVSAKHHIQLCVRRRSCIKGYFRPLDESRLPRD